MPRLRIRPGREKAILGVVTGVIMVGVGIFWAIPIFGGFGVVWTLIAVATAGYNAFIAFSDQGAESEVDFDGFDRPQFVYREPEGLRADNDTESRLRELEGLRNQGLITNDEYQQKREEILREL